MKTRPTRICPLAISAPVILWTLSLNAHCDFGTAEEHSCCNPKKVVYSNPDADEVLRLMFPCVVHPTSIAKALVEPESVAAWANLDDTAERHNEVQTAVPTSRKVVEFPCAPMESYWLIATENAQKAMALATSFEAAKLIDLIPRLEKSDALAQSTLEKALLQRDIVHIASIFVGAREQLKHESTATRYDRLIHALSSLVRTKLLLSEDEYRELRRESERHIDLSAYSDSGDDVRRDYLPIRAITDDDSWLPMQFHFKYHVHYAKYRGRSFFRSYARIPGMSPEQFKAYRNMVARTFGSRVNTASGVPELPAGSETLLVRSMGVLLMDGSVADSGIVEEVLIRKFLTKQMEFNRNTSDFRGTNHFQYLLDRQRYQSGNRDPGLRRIQDDQPAYLGFFPCAPDVHTSWNEHVTMARFNCIICHSESRHGAATVFSLGYEDVRNPAYLFDDHPFASLDRITGRVRLKTQEFLAIWGDNR